jgi:RNA polymerase sigma factor (TIGR02999 family)
VSDINDALERLRAGNKSGFDEVVGLLYEELHCIAARQLRAERASHTLQPTALVNEAYLKLIGGGQCEFEDRAHFLAVASRVMRQVLVDYARARASKKRGAAVALESEGSMVTLQFHAHSAGSQVELLDLDAALESLDRENHFLARLVEMRYFGGMTAEETAGVLGRSVHVVRHDLRLAQAWLRRNLSV